MKFTHVMAAALSASLFLAATAATAAPTQMTLRGKMSFVSDAPLERIEGTAEGQATLSIDFDAPATITGEIVVGVATMKTGNDRRDGHLRGTDWLDAAAHPDIRFKVTSVTAEPTVAKGEVKMVKLQVTGEFTLHGVTKPLTAPAEMKWKGKKVKITTKFPVKLADFAVKGAQGVVGRKVGDAISVDVTLLGAAP